MSHKDKNGICVSQSFFVNVGLSVQVVVAGLLHKQSALLEFFFWWSFKGSLDNSVFIASNKIFRVLFGNSSNW